MPEKFSSHHKDLDYMATILFDFDSTILDCESLEELLASTLADSPEKQKRFKEITNLAMDGSLPFSEALEARLSLAQPTLSLVEIFAKKASERLTAGIADLIQELMKRGIEVWIVSGGLLEILRSVGCGLGIPKDQIWGVELLWNGEGGYAGINRENVFSISKVEGVRSLNRDLSSPRVVVGDGMTDYDLRAAGLVDYFVAFTEHVERESVVVKADSVAKNVSELSVILERLTYASQ